VDTPFAVLTEDQPLSEAAPAGRHVDVSVTPSPHSRSNRFGRVAWKLVWRLLFRTSPTPLHGWRRFLLRRFGATIHSTAEPYPGVRIWAPWNLEMGAYSTLADDVDCYCVDRVLLGDHATVSQYSFLCTAAHDYSHPNLPLTTAPITIGAGAWVAADVFIAPGVTIGEGAVVGACSRVFKDVPPWMVAAGHPAKVIKERVMQPAAPRPAR
jgi:putative colanic acid biosynthesis acetyltransferase WcaF